MTEDWTPPHDVTVLSEHLAAKYPDTLASRRVTAADNHAIAPDEVPFTGADLRELRDLP